MSVAQQDLTVIAEPSESLMRGAEAQDASACGTLSAEQKHLE